MKFKQIPIALVAILAVGLAGCSKNETATTAAEDANKAAEVARAEATKTADAAKAEADRVAKAAQVEAAKTADAANAELAKTAAAAKAQAAVTAEAAKADAAKADAEKAANDTRIQALIDKARVLIAENKLPDASSVLQQLNAQSLSDPQKKLVDDLKDQIQKAIVAKASNSAASGVGDLLKK